MKLTIFILTLSILSSFAAESYSQTTKLTISENNATLLDVIRIIEGQSEFKFFYNEKVDVKMAVSVEVNQKSVTEILDKVLSSTSVKYKVLGRQIALYDKNEMEPFMSEQQVKKISGKVTDQSGTPLPGASIVVKGTTTGITTDNDGNFSISLPSDAKALVFSFIGMKSQEIAIGNKSTINASMQEESIGLDEVVAVGYGTQKKATLTGSVSAVKSSEIMATKNENVKNMLTGKVAGLRVVQNSSEPGSFNNDFDIRGFGKPLIIIDGIPRDNIDRLDPNDIESLSVLKDASAAVYGVRAANGVVLITTKRGKKDAFELSYSGSYTFQQPSGLPKPLDAADYMVLRNESYMHSIDNSKLLYSDAEINAYKNGSKQGTNWYDQVIQNLAPQSQHSLTATGGNDRITYYTNFGYLSQDGFLKSDDLKYNRYNIRSNITGKITNNLTVELNLNAILDKKDQPYQDAWWIIRNFWRENPLQPVFANNDTQKFNYGWIEGDNLVPMSSSNFAGYKKFVNRWVQSSMDIKWDIPYIKGLQFHALGSYDYNNSENSYYKQEYSVYSYDEASQKYTTFVRQSPNSIRREYFANTNLMTQVSLNYNHKFNEKHDLSALLLCEQSVRKADNFFAQRELPLPLDLLLAGNSNNQVGYMSANNIYEFTNIGIVGKLNYNFSSKYLTEFNFRYDGSSRFGSSHQWGFFPSASVGWRISDENFFKNSSSLLFVNNLKLRASYGVLGDDGASSYQFITGYNYPASGSANLRPGGYVFDGSFVSAVESKGIPNPNITWYQSKTSDIGIDFEAWKGLFGVNLDYFVRNRTGLLTTRALSLPSEVGAALPQENLNGDKTSGYEIELNHRNHINDLRYNLKGIFSYSRTMITYQERSNSTNSYENWKNNLNNRYSNIWWGYGGAGQFQNYGEIINSPVYYGRGTLPGDYAYQDWNGDGMISSLDEHPISYSYNSTMPLINFGLNINLEYKGFDFNALIQGAALRYIISEDQLRIPLWGNVNSNALSQFMDRWHPEDPNAYPYNPATKWIPGSFAYTGSSPTYNSAFNLQNASYLRLKSIELGYTFPHSHLLIIGVKSLRIFANAYNILTLTGVKYVDPEHPSSSLGYLYPLNKTYTLGLTIKL